MFPPLERAGLRLCGDRRGPLYRQDLPVHLRRTSSDQVLVRAHRYQAFPPYLSSRPRPGSGALAAVTVRNPRPAAGPGGGPYAALRRGRTASQVAEFQPALSARIWRTGGAAPCALATGSCRRQRGHSSSCQNETAFSAAVMMPTLIVSLRQPSGNQIAPPPRQQLRTLRLMVG